MMRSILLIAVFFGLAFSAAFGQNAKKEFMSYLENKEYPKAAKIIPQVLKENPEDQQLHLIAGDVYMELNEYQKALETFKEADKIDGGEPQVERKIGLAYAHVGNYEESFEILRDLIDDEDNVENLLALANAYLMADSTSQAELMITKAKKKDDENPMVLTMLGDLYYTQRVYELAKINYEKALKFDPNLIEARIKLASAYYWLATREVDQELANELFKRSLEEWNKITQLDPKNAKAFFEQGKIYFFSKKYEKAALSLNNYIQLRPGGDLGRWYLAQSLERIGNCGDAVEHLKKSAQNIDSVSGKANLLLARCQFDLEKYNEAIETYKNIKQDTTLNVMDIQKMGQAHMLLKDTTKATQVWEESVQKYPAKSCKIMDQLGYIYQKQKKYDDAIRILQQRASTEACGEQKLNVVYYLMGQSYLFSGRPDSAIVNLNRAIEQDTTFYFAMISLGDAYTQVDSVEKAQETFNTVIDMAANDTTEKSNVYALQTAYSKLAGIRMDQKDFNGIIKVAKKWAESFPKAEFAYLYLAIAYHNLQDGPNACRYYKKVLSINPKNNTASKNLGNLRANGMCGGGESSSK